MRNMLQETWADRPARVAGRILVAAATGSSRLNLELERAKPGQLLQSGSAAPASAYEDERAELLECIAGAMLDESRGEAQSLHLDLLRHLAMQPALAHGRQARV